MVTQPHLDAIERARRAFEADERVLALWLEGSMGRGTADAGSDVDLHLAVADDAFDAFVESPAAVIETAGRPLGYLVVPLPHGRIFPAAVAGPARVDLYVEQRGSIAPTPREPGHSMLFDRDEVERDIEASPGLRMDAPAFLRDLMRGYWFGTMWPRRFITRGEWGALLMNATAVVYQFIVPAMLLADGSTEFYRETYGRARFLRPERRAAVDALLAHAARTFVGLEDGAPDLDTVVAFHAELMAAIWAAFREACAVVGVEYDEAAETEYRAYYERELGMTIPPLD